MKREIWIFRIVIILSLLVGYLVAYYFAASLNKWICKNDMVYEPWLIFGIVTSACLFISGFINAKFRR